MAEEVDFAEVEREIGQSPTLQGFEDVDPAFTSAAEQLAAAVRAYSNIAPAVEYTKDTTPVLRGATYLEASPDSWREQRENVKRSYVIIHRPSDNEKAATAEATILEALRPKPEKESFAAHFLITTAGRLVQFVPLTHTAKHIGTKAGSPVYNDNSIGIELEGAVGSEFSQAQLAKLGVVLAQLRDIPTYNFAIKIDRSHLLGHSELNQYRPSELNLKTDPGSNFPYDAIITLVNNIPALSFPDQVLASPRIGYGEVKLGSVGSSLSKASNNLDRALITFAFDCTAAFNRASVVLGQTRKDYPKAAEAEAKRLINYFGRIRGTLHQLRAASTEAPIEFTNLNDVLLDFSL